MFAFTAAMPWDGDGDGFSHPRFVPLGFTSGSLYWCFGLEPSPPLTYTASCPKAPQVGKLRLPISAGR
jgi:hypothetical protein